MRFTTLQEWLDWQETLHPSEIELGLERVERVWNRLSPERLVSIVITIAGTNGKGSSAALLESILLAAGHTVGCYTSPHLLDYNERIRVNGQQASDQIICNSFNRVDSAREDATLTYFEFGTLAALDIFASEQPDVIILEVGLGGRLDAVNIIDPDVSLITTIDIDHTDWLGDTRDEIALEKAGILRSGRPAVFGGENPPITLMERARELGVSLSIAGVDFTYCRTGQGWNWEGRDASYKQLPEPQLKGGFILQNCSAALMVLEHLQDRLKITVNSIARGIETLSIHGRFQVIPGDITLILDVAHNPEAVAELAVNLSGMHNDSRTLAVFSALADKDIAQMVEPLVGLIDCWYIGELESNRAATQDEICKSIAAAGANLSNVDSHKFLSQALTKAMADAETHDKLVIFGSFLTVAEAMRHQDVINLLQNRVEGEVCG
jgi:dihydrofolate synthase/folylpolyglutamate synthase